MGQHGKRHRGWGLVPSSAGGGLVPHHWVHTMVSVVPCTVGGSWVGQYWFFPCGIQRLERGGGGGSSRVLFTS